MGEIIDRRPWPLPADAAEAMVRRTLAACVDKVQANSVDGVLERLRQRDPALWSHCRGVLAEHVGEYLQACDTDVKAVFLYDNECTPDDENWAQVTDVPLVHLIVWAQPKTAALRALIDILNRALALRLGQVVGKLSVTQLLDVQVVDDNEMSRRSGYAALLTSSHNRPAQVSKRQAASA